MMAVLAVAAGVTLAPCPVEDVTGDVRCGTYSVWEDRVAKKGRQVALHVIVLRALEEPRAPDPVFMLLGGPGQAPSFFVRFASSVFAEVRRHRDVVLVDLRGTGRSGSLACPELAEPGPGGSLGGEWLPPDGVTRCRDRLAKTADVRLYTTEIAMADLDEVRSALGYEQINLFGVSYGTRAAQVFLRDFPKSTRTLTLKGVVAPSTTSPARHAPDGERAWRALVDRCTADPACRAAYPTLDQDLRSVVNRLRAKPAVFDAKTPLGRAARLTLTAGLFGETFHNLLSNPGPAAPSTLARLVRSDYRSFGGRALVARTFMSGAEMSAGYFLSVSCTEDVPFVPADAARAAASTFGGDYRLKQQARACEIWPRGVLPNGRAGPVQSTVPALLLSGDQDPITPPAQAEEVVRHLPNGRHVVVANIGHVWGPLRECGQKLVATFIAKGSASGLDVSCLSQVPAVPFAIPKEQ